MKESKTFIVATIGPASEKKEVLKELVKHHLNIARLNFSWGTHEEYVEYIKNIRESATELNSEVSIINRVSSYFCTSKIFNTIFSN